ncbi:MAG: hypothetical protein LBQ88_02490 [Treponema sp.]|nr:hypothetical protein [Treponema sp.]
MTRERRALSSRSSINRWAKRSPFRRSREIDSMQDFTATKSSILSIGFKRYSLTPARIACFAYSNSL